MDPGKESGPESVGAETRPELKPCVVGDSRELLAHRPDARQAITAAASAALPICELEAQAFGTRQTWGTHARPGRIEARARAIRLLVRAAEIALETAPDIKARHVEAALRSLAIRPSDVMVCAITGEWITTKPAIRNRGEEVARALVELARIIKTVEAPEP